MGASSQYKGLVAGSVAGFLTSLAPMDTGLISDVLVNGAAHHVDEQPQHMVNWLSPKSSSFKQPATVSTDAHAPIFVCAEDMSLHFRADGSPPLFIIRACGAWGTNSGTVTFLFAIVNKDVPEGSLIPSGATSGYDIGSIAFSSSTPAWNTTPLVLQTRLTLDQMTDWQPTLTTFGGASGTVAIVNARLEVWAYSNGGGVVPRLYGLQCRGYVGP